MTDTRHVLIIDDNVINAELANAHLRRAGWVTQITKTGADALSAFETARFDLVLLDISMPGMSGIEVCHAIRGRDVEPRPCIVAYTAHAMNEERTALLNGGFDDVLTKPIDRRSVQAMLDRMGFARADSGSVRRA